MKHLSEYSAADVTELARSDVARALAEDVGAGDLTAALVPADRIACARILAREPAVICGQPWVEAAVLACDPSAQLTWHVAEGQRCVADQVIVEFKGNAQALLTAERTGLNFMQMMSAVATKTAAFVGAVSGTRANIVDTRKTLPGLRLAQKYAVKVGGGVNHRIGLYDAVLIKENHIAAAGGVPAVLKRVAETAPQARFVEIEVETLVQLEEALSSGATMVLLDNMDIPTLNEAVRMNAGRAILEVSGGVGMDTVRALAETGVNRISIGALTKDVKAIDACMSTMGPMFTVVERI
jgi:nicotinate-nucleotide pyrophosphorylase (carboxylating)